ncbi:TIR domain-containing protein [Bacillus cereus]|nr:TIR domain-containing protein [Bacillus cereus]
MLNVFISHNYKDKPLARKIANELVSYGIKPWIDESEIKLGDSLIEKIRDGLDQVDYLVALISENSIQSEWVKKELDIAMNSEIEGKKITTIPILAGKCNLPLFLKGKLYADMSTRRQYNENIGVLLRRFNVNDIKDAINAINEFTDYKLTPVQVIEKLENTEGEDELIEFLESFGYSERNLFYRDTFVQCLNKLLNNKHLSQDILVSLVNICKYCPESYMKKLNLTKLLMSADREVLKATIKVLNKTKCLKIQQKKICNILKENEDDELINTALDFFINVELDLDIEQEVYDFCINKVKENYDIKVINCLCKISNSIMTDKIFKMWMETWESADDNRKEELIHSLCKYGFQSEYTFLKSPKLRDEIKQILMGSFGKDDVNNANIMIAILTSAGNIFEDKDEVWGKLYELDNYSTLLTLETLRDNFNIDYILYSKEDLIGLQRFLDSINPMIRSVALEIIAEIHSKDAIDIIKESGNFIPQYFNACSLLFTLVKETNVVDYKEVYELVRERIINGYCSKINNLYIAFCDYLIGDSNLEIIISAINFKIEDEKESERNYRKKINVITERLTALEITDKKQYKKIQDFVRSCKNTKISV